MADQAYPCTCHVEETCVVHGTPPDSQSPASYQPPMNWQERARRAEMIAERLAAALSAHHLYRLGETPETPRAGYRADTQAALDAYASFRADLDTLAQAQQEGR